MVRQNWITTNFIQNKNRRIFCLILETNIWYITNVNLICKFISSISKSKSKTNGQTDRRSDRFASNWYIMKFFRNQTEKKCDPDMIEMIVE